MGTDLTCSGLIIGVMLVPNMAFTRPSINLPKTYVSGKRLVLALARLARAIGFLQGLPSVVPKHLAFFRGRFPKLLSELANLGLNNLDSNYHKLRFRKQ